MSEKKRAGIFLSAGERLFLWLGVERIPEAARAWYEARNERFLCSRCGALFDGAYDRRGWQYRLRRWGMRARERSALVRLRQRLGEYLLSSSVGYVGLWLLVTGLSLLILTLILWKTRADTASLYACALLILLSAPLMGSSHSLSRILLESRVLGSLLLGACDFPPEMLGRGGKGEARPMGVLAGAAIATAVGGLLSPPILCVLLFLFPLLLLLFSVPELALLLFLGAIPAVQWSAHPTVLLFLLALLLQVAFWLKAYCGRRDLSFELSDAPVLIFCLLLALGGIFGAGDAREGLLTSFFAFLYFPVKQLASTVRWRRRALRALLLGGLVTSLIGIYQYFSGRAALSWVDAERFSDIGGRVTGVFENPNVLGIYLTLLFPVAACLAMDPKGRRAERIGAAVCALSILFCAVLTWSRGAWLAILVECVLLFLLWGRRTAALLLLSPLALCAAIPFLPSGVLRRFLSIGSLADSSIRYRLYTWSGVLRMIAEHPFGIGVGEAAFRAVYPQYALSGIETVMHAHQILLQLAAELGIGGAVCFAGMLFLLIVKGIGKKSTLGFACALCGAFVMGMFDHLWYETGMAALLFVIAAFAAGGEELT